MNTPFFGIEEPLYPELVGVCRPVDSAGLVARSDIIRKMIWTQRWIFTAFLAAGLGLWLTACATKPGGPGALSPPPTPPAVSTAGSGASVMLVLVPTTDENAAGWIQLLNRHRTLRAVLAISPRFKSFAADSPLKSQLMSLQKSGRLELALQLPNAPFLPLLIDTNVARDALGPDSALPDPSFSYPDDVIQIVARAKADFYHAWHALPRGIVLPYGAASPALLSLFDHLGFNWLIGAFQAPSSDLPYSSRSITIWDGAAAAGSGKLHVRVWDERSMKRVTWATVELWAKDLESDGAQTILPSDAGMATATPLPPPPGWKRRTWTTADWSPWIGSPAKNAAWNWLRTTRETLESYKNSGRASVPRLDVAFENVYTAENSAFFAAMGNEMLAPAQTEDRLHEFQATLTSIYRLMNEPPPDALFSASTAAESTAVMSSSASSTADVLPDGREHLLFTDPVGDAHGDGHLALPPGMHNSGVLDLRAFEVMASSISVDFKITLASAIVEGSGSSITPLIDIYIDLNGSANAGTLNFLPGRNLAASVTDAWEYALSFTRGRAQLYRTQNGGTYTFVDSFAVVMQNGQPSISIPRSILRGNPRRWGYQVLVMALNPTTPQTEPRPLSMASGDRAQAPVYDLLDPAETPQAALLQEIESGQRGDVPFARLRRTY